MVFIMVTHINYLFLFTLTNPVKPADLDKELDSLGAVLGGGFIPMGIADFSSSATFSTASYKTTIKAD